MSVDKSGSLKMPRDLTSAMRSIDDLDRLERPKPEPENITILQDYQQSSNTASNMDGHKDSLPRSNISSFPDDQPESQSAENIPVQPVSRSSSHRTILSAGNKASKPVSRTASKPDDSLVIQEADRLASSPPVAITGKLADELNDWVDEIAHQLRKSKVKKQDIITLAVKRLYVDVQRNGGALPEDL